MSSITVVTGGAGFIGSHLISRLVERGEPIRVVERPGVTVDHLPRRGVDVVFADIRDRLKVERALRGCGVVYHLAANPNLWTRRRGHFYQVNYRGTVHVLEAALANGARRILHTSTESILTTTRQRGLISENQEVRLADALGPYCRSKLMAERFALKLGRQGAPVVVVNPTVPVGPGDLGRSPPTQMILDFCQGKRREYLEGTINLVDVRDVAEGMIRAMERAEPGRRYLLGHENLSLQDVFGCLAELTGLPKPTWRVPYLVALMAAHASEAVADLWTERMPLATVTGVRLTRRIMHFDTQPSWRELGLTPRPVRQALAEAINWYRGMGWLSAGE